MNVSENTITELKEKERKEPSVTEKVMIYFNIFKCGRNLLNPLSVTYKREFIATPGENDYYKKMLKNLIKVNNNEGGPLWSEKLWQEVIDLREEIQVEH